MEEFARRFGSLLALVYYCFDRIDGDRRPIRQYELCASHAESVAERGKGREIVTRG